MRTVSTVEQSRVKSTIIEGSMTQLTATFLGVAIDTAVDLVCLERDEIKPVDNWFVLFPDKLTDA